MACYATDRQGWDSDMSEVPYYIPREAGGARTPQTGGSFRGAIRLDRHKLVPLVFGGEREEGLARPASAGMSCSRAPALEGGVEGMDGMGWLDGSGGGCTRGGLSTSISTVRIASSRELTLSRPYAMTSFSTPHDTIP